MVPSPALETDERYTIASIIAPVHVPEEQAGRVRARQLDSVNRLGILTVLTNLLNAAIVMVMFMDGPASNYVSVWGSVICLACAIQFIYVTRSQSGPVETERSADGIRRHARGAAIFGVLWGALPLISMPFADPFEQAAIGTICAGLVFGASSILSRIPVAAFSFMLPLAAGYILALQFTPNVNSLHVSLLVVCYAAVIGVCVRWDYNQFVAQLLSETAVAEQNSLIGLLLRDFEESTSDWLWQTDARGRLEALPLSVEGAKSGYHVMSHGRSLVSLFERSEARTVLSACMSRQQGFRDLVLRVNIDDEERWWSITGKPIYVDGEFVGFRGVSSDITQSKQIEDKIAYLAHFDGLTGLPNRATFQERLERHVARGVPPGRTMAILWMDLDNFKWVNDTLGHPAGDELLRQLSERLTRCCEPSDTVARLGGDEFALIVQRRDKAALDRFLDDLVSQLDRPYDIWGSTANCGASIGVRPFTAGDDDPQAMLTHADLALYKAKKQGKGTWSEFTSDLDEKAKARRMIESDLHAALGNNELCLKFQPIINAATREVVSCETLMRWHHPERGPIMPGEFIEHAEDCGLITRMGDWVIREALAQARFLPETVGVSVNISPLQLHSSTLVTTIVNALARNRIDPARLDLEITESVLLADTDFVLERLMQLKSLGLKISLDDFGTGFSSLSYLRSFPFDKIKIDKSFVGDLESNEDSRVITRTTITLAHSLGMRCTAEGVETEAQSAFLVDHGCDEIQGFLISRAKTLEELSHLLPVQAAPDTPADEATNVLDLAGTGPQRKPARGRKSA